MGDEKYKKFFAELELYERSGVSMRLDNYPASPMQIVTAHMVREDKSYMRDYVWDENHTFRIIGTYEEDFLNKLKSLGWSPNDIVAPSPNNYWYKWKDGSTHLYIPDFYIISLNLEIEIKEINNTHPRMVHNREIEYLKDARMRKECDKTGLHYLKIVDKKYDEFIELYVKSDNNQPE